MRENFGGFHLKSAMCIFVAFVPEKYHWGVFQENWYCDDRYPDPVSQGDFWKIYVR